jgi:pyrroloquinoline quinone (PQQ) biosynthesis protein C
MASKTKAVNPAGARSTSTRSRARPKPRLGSTPTDIPTKRSDAMDRPILEEAGTDVIERLDALVDDFVRRTAFLHEPLTESRAKMFVCQHRLNTRQRNSVLKLRVATNCPDWETRLDIVGACSEEIIADHEFGGGKPHWQVLEELGIHIGMSQEEIRQAEPLTSTRLAWLAWESLMGNRHWLEGIVGNTCAERANVPGYGTGILKEHGWFGLERQRWSALFGLSDEDLIFFGLHEEADVVHSERGWKAIAQHASDLRMEDAVVEACRMNLAVWEHYLDGIGRAADAI